MGFLQPLALFGLFAAAVPPLLHLINRRVPPLIAFPPLRYLTETERRYSRRLKLRHLLLLILRTAIVVLIALAASRPVARLPIGSMHDPSDIVLIVDNSLSSGAIVSGRTVLSVLVDRARAVLDRSGNGDRFWLMVADGVPRRTSVPEMRAVLDTLAPWPVYFDIAAGVATAVATFPSDIGVSREVVVVSDMQASAFTVSTAPGSVSERVLVWGDSPVLAENRGLDSAWSDPPVWSPAGRVIAAIGGVAAPPAAVRLLVGGRDIARSFGGVGDRVVLEGAPRPGWHAARVELDPDELRADDGRSISIFVAPPAAVMVGQGAGQFVEEAVGVLALAGRLRSEDEGSRVFLVDQPTTTGTAIVFPPSDPSLIGAVNRDLRARGVSWQFGDIESGEWTWTDGNGPAGEASVFRRRRLEGGVASSVLVELAGQPWIVRDGDVILVASRLDPAWTSLPLSASFVPFLDLLINRMAARQVFVVRAEPGGPVSLPPSAVGWFGLVEGATGGGGQRAPMEDGVYFLRGAAGDTVGALEVNHDPRESRLAHARARDIEGAFGGDVQVLDDAGMDRELFGGARRADLTGLMILLAVLAAVVEMIVATLGGGRGTDA